MSVPNQKIVQVAPRTARSKTNLYATMNIDALQQAMRDLKGSGLKMWLYFNKNQNNYTFELSRKACEEWGIKKDSYYDGLRKLEEKGYLRQSHQGSNFYQFYETPRTENQNGGKLNNWFSEETNFSSGNQNNISEKQSLLSGNQYRNNTYSTKILQNNTLPSFPKIERKPEWDRLGF